MPAGVSLNQLIEDLKAEAGISLNAAHNLSQRTPQVYLLNRVQRELYEAHDWPDFKVTRDVNLFTDQRYYDMPTDMDYDGVNDAYARYGNQWSKLAYGIEPEDMSIYNTDDGFKTYPPLKWASYPDETRQFEVWPIPSEDGVIRFRGTKTLTKMVDNADLCELDATLIVLFAASEILAKAKAEDAPLKLQKAQAMFTRLKAKKGSNKRGVSILGGGDTGLGRGPRVGIDFIPWGYGKGG